MKIGNLKNQLRNLLPLLLVLFVLLALTGVNFANQKNRTSGSKPAAAPAIKNGSNQEFGKAYPQHTAYSSGIGHGLENQIESFIKEHPGTGLIVIDTLQKVRKTVSANVNPYASDYDDINALKQIADQHHLAILLVHHLRKTGDADPLNMISGTSGIAGGADTNFVLQKDKRTENTATLFCTGRDIEGRELFLEFNKNKFLWELLEPIEMEQRIIPEEIFLLCDFIKSAGSFTGTATELIENLNLDCSPAILKKRIIKHMEHLGRNGIHYSENRTFERREFTLYYDGNDDMTAESSPQNLPSLPSAPSQDSNLAAVAPCSPPCGENDGGVA